MLYSRQHKCKWGKGDGVFGRDNGCRPIEFLHRLGVLPSKKIIAHGTHVNERELELISISNTMVAPCISSEKALQTGIFPSEMYATSNITVLPSTDGPASCSEMNVWQEAEALDRSLSTNGTIEKTSSSRLGGFLPTIKEVFSPNLADIVAYEVLDDCVRNETMHCNLVQLLGSRPAVSALFVNGKRANYGLPSIR